MRESMVGVVVEISGIFLRVVLKSIEVQFVSVAPAPVLARLKRLDDRVFGVAVVRARVPVLGRVAAADMSAGKTQTQMNPAVSHFETLFAALSAGGNFVNFTEVCAGCCRHRTNSWL